MVHLPNDVGGTLVVAGQIAEQRSCDSHIQRCRHSFSCHVADNEEELIVLDDEVVEVAAHLLGRSHRGIELKVLPLWKCRRDHAHLDVMGNLQLALQPFLAGSGGLQVVDMLFQGTLHVFERVPQLQQFVFRMDGRQGSVKIAVGYRHDRLGKLSQWSDHLVDGPRTEYK